jgi:hypothetical protein
MRMIKTERMVQEGEVGEILPHRNRWGSAALLAGLLQEIRSAWGHDLQRNEGGIGEEAGATYRHRGVGRNGRSLTRIEGGNLQRGNGLRRDLRSREEEDPALTGGAQCQRVWERDRVPVREGALLGHGLASSLGRNGAPGPFHIFSFLSLFLFWFSYFLIFFSNLIQIKPNYFHRFCRIYSKVLNQHQTYFQNQNEVFSKRSKLSQMALLA